MKIIDRSIKERLKMSIETTTPNVLPEVLQYMEYRKNEDIRATNTYKRIGLRERKKNSFNNKLYLRIASIAICLMMVFGIQKAYSHLSTESIINFDVNPSIELKVNSFEKVLRANPLNDNARLVIGDMKLKNIDLEIAVNALIGSMVKNGYISSSNNSILISVDSKRDEKGTKLQEELLQDINSFLNQYEVEGAVLSQKIKVEDKTEIKEIAKTHNISTGKAKLIQSLVSIDKEKQFEEMVNLSINDLNLLIEDKQTPIQGVSKLGQANDVYIGKEKAQEIVLAQENLEKDKIQSLGVERDFEKGRMIYRASFNINKTDYKYNIDAISGQILEIESKVLQDPSEPECPPGEKPEIEVKYIGRTKAKKIGLNHAKLKEDQVKELKIELEKEKDPAIYSLGFKTDNSKYEYRIDAISGKIIKEDKTPINPPSQAEDPPEDKPDIEVKYIGESKAKDNALKDAKLNEDQIKELKIDLEKDTAVYRVKFNTSTSSYKYKIDAISGEITERERTSIIPPKEPEDPDKEDIENEYIGVSNAKIQALMDAGLKENQVSQLRVEFKNEDDLKFYMVRFFSSGSDYRYDIDAKTGKKIFSEKKKI